MSNMRMAYFDSHPLHFRILLSSVIVLILCTATLTFIRIASSPSDENFFRNLPSGYYITKSFPAKFERVLDNASPKIVQLAMVDSILVGDFGIQIGDTENQNPVSPAQIDSLLAIGQTGRLTVMRGSLNVRIQYRVDTRLIPRDAYRVLKNGVFVIAVAEEGASDRAGMKVGDVITGINGRGFKDMYEADRLMREGQAGASFRYEILRANKSYVLDVVLAKFGIPIVTLAFALCGLLYLATGAFVSLKRPQYKGARILGWMFLLFGFGLILFPVPSGYAVDWYLRVRNFVAGPCFFLGIAVSIQSLAYFPIEHPNLIAKRWFPWTGLALTIIAVVAQNTFRGFNLLILLPIAYAVVVQFIFRKQRPSAYKRMTRAIMVFALLGGLFIVVSIVLRNMLLISETGQAILLAISFSLFPLAYLYTIGRYRLYDLKLRIRRNVQYSFVTAGWVVLLVLVAGKLFFLFPRLQLDLPNIVFRPASIEITNAPLSPAERNELEKIVLMGIAIGLVFLTWHVRKFGQNLIDRKYHRSQYDYQLASAELADVMATRLGMVDLARGIVEKLSQHMKLKRAGVIFFRNQQRCCCQEAHGFDGQTWNQLCFDVEPEMIRTLQPARGELNVDRLPEGLKSEFSKNHIRYLIPIHSKEKLVGALLIGEKLSESSFTHDDFSFLTSAAAQSSVAIENAFLYEELAEKERMKHELNIARKIQLASLPQKTPMIRGLEIAGISVPAQEVGGDFYDYLNGVAGKLTVVVGDVSGKGTSAALYMSKVQGILRSLHGFGLSPRELFIRANHLLCNDLEKNSFVTAMGATFNPGQHTLVLARAGHLPLYHYSFQSGKVEKITPRGLGLGLSPEDLFSDELEERVVQYQSGDVFVFVTDGLTEGRRNTGDEFGEERLEHLIETSSTMEAAALRDRFIDAVNTFAGSMPQHDDQTVVVVKVNGD
jgi:serine phosphatase RsbU (regulator of sigma subunit)/MFS family permease